MASRIFMWTALWVAICSLSALPSFMIAAGEGFDQAAMGVGILAFVLLYVVVSCTDTMARRWAVDRAFRITAVAGYGLRLFIGLVFPLGVMIDIWPGALAVEVIQSLELERRGFLATLLTTLLQGCFLNLILLVFMATLYAIVKPFIKPATEARGFMVIAPNAAVDEVQDRSNA